MQLVTRRFDFRGVPQRLGFVIFPGSICKSSLGGLVIFQRFTFQLSSSAFAAAFENPTIAPEDHYFFPLNQFRRVVNNYHSAPLTFKESTSFQLSLDAMCWPTGMDADARAKLIRDDRFQMHYRSVSHLFSVGG